MTSRTKPTKWPNGEETVELLPGLRLPSSARPFSASFGTGIGVAVVVGEIEVNSWQDHRHLDYWQILITSPAAFCRARITPPGGRRIRRDIPGGSIWVLPPGIMHGLQWHFPGQAIVFFIDAARVANGFPNLPATESVKAFDCYAHVRPELIDLRMETMHLAAQRHGLAGWKLGAIGTHFAVALLEAHARLTSGHAASRRAHVEHLIEQVKTRLLSELPSRRLGDDLARTFGLSARQLRRQFHRYTGLSMRAFVALERAKTAKRLLEAGENTKVAADLAGFTETGYLRRSLRKQFGVSVSAFRRRSRMSDQCSKMSVEGMAKIPVYL